MAKPDNNNDEKKSSTLDKAQQRQILKRFLQITLGRLARIRLDLSKEQQLFLDALPILLNNNHASFPCYVSDFTPSGICRYTPSGAEIQKIQRLAPGFNASDASQNKQQILGVYLSGDCGTITESEQQNITVWVCHKDGLATNEISQLDRKCKLIEEWSTSLQLKTIFHVVDSNFINADQQHKRADEEKQQNFLQLDRLYRSGIMIAGRMPVWWLVPTTEEKKYKQYASILVHKKFIADEDVISFGWIPDIPASELISIATEQLAQSYDNPHEACIKQLLTEIYISEYPKTRILSRLFKEAVYDDNLDLDALDPYVMVYRRIESYLFERNEINRLELIRRCFYFQVGKQLSQHTKNVTWQRKVMEALVKEWGWSKDTLKDLDHRDNWNTERAKAEHFELVKELTASYRFLSEFTRRHRDEAVLSLNEMNKLGKKLYATMERKSGKVDLINSHITTDLAEKNLCFCQTKHRLKTVWTVYAEPVSHKETTNTLPLRRSESLIELVSWCHFNGLIAETTEIDILKGEHNLTEDELLKIISSLQEQLPANSHLLSPPQENFSKPAYPINIQMYANIAADPELELKNKDKNPMGLANTFHYTDNSDNIIINIETVSINSWGEIICKRFEGGITLLNSISEYMQNLPPGSNHNVPELQIHSFCNKQAEAISKRLKELYNDIESCYYRGKLPVNSRYILQMKTQFFIIQYSRRKTHFKGARNINELVKRLGQDQESYSPIIFDRHALPTSELAALTSTMSENSIQVYFIDNKDKTATLYVIDEKGSLYSITQEYLNKEALLQPLETFLHSALYRQSTSEHSESLTTEGGFFIDTPIMYYEILNADKNQPPRIEPIILKEHLSSNGGIKIQAIAEQGPNNKPLFNIFCDQQEFSAVDWGPELYSAVARFILARRQSGKRYPCHISDLDMSSIGSLDGYIAQTADYLRFKKDIEDHINDALQKV